LAITLDAREEKNSSPKCHIIFVDFLFSHIYVSKKCEVNTTWDIQAFVWER